MSLITKSIGTATVVVGVLTYLAFGISAKSLQALKLNIQPSSSTTAKTSPSVSQIPATPQGSSTATETSQSSSDVTLNWSGYEATGGLYSGVSGSWAIPSVSSSGATSADATWVGIGGVSSSDLIQIGTQDVVDPSGQVSASAFYEMLPDASQTITDVNVNPGDSISASVEQVGTDLWSITLKDNTTGQSFSQTVNYGSSESSAEWIEEDPSSSDASQIPLDNFGTIDFSDGLTIDNGSSQTIAASGAQALTMESEAGQALETTSPLTADGTSFSVTRSSATSGPGISQYNSDPGIWRRQGFGLHDFGGGGFTGSGFGDF